MTATIQFTPWKLTAIPSWMPRIRRVIAWYDLWVGVFWDAKRKRLYMLPVPCLGVLFEWPIKVFRVCDEDEECYSCEAFWDYYLIRPEDGRKPFTTIDISLHGLRKC